MFARGGGEGERGRVFARGGVLLTYQELTVLPPLLDILLITLVALHRKYHA